MNFARIVIVKKWIESTTRRHIWTFLKFVKFYRRFIEKFNKTIKSLTNFFKKKKKEKFNKEFKFTKKTRLAFAQLKEIFIKTSILLHFDLKRKTRLKIDAFNFAISKIFVLIDWRNKSMTFRRVLLSKNVRRRTKLWNRRNWNAHRDRVVSSFSTLCRKCVVFCSNVNRSR
jgi:hypothetical protein